MARQTLAIVAVLLACCWLIGCRGEQHQPTPEPTPPQPPQLELSTNPAMPRNGDTLEVRVMLTSGQPLSDLSYDLVWDHGSLTLLESNPGEFFSVDQGCSFSAIPDPNDAGRLHLAHGAERARPGQGVLAMLRFNVNAVSGLQTGIMLDRIIADVQGKPVKVNETDGMVVSIK